MSIALIVHDLHEHGGHSLYTKVLADGLSRTHEVAVFANRCERPSDAKWQSHHVRAWRSTALATVQSFPLGLRSHAQALAGYDIRHMQGYCGRRPNVVTAHRCMASYVRALSSVPMHHRFSLRVMLDAESRFYRNYDGAIIAISRQIAVELQEFYRVRGPVTVIPHGVNSERFHSRNRDLYRTGVRQQLRLKDNDLVALYVGDLTKAHVHLKKMARAMPNVHLVVVSPSKTYHWKASNVTILSLSRQIERYYAAADAFVFPTVNDPFGMVVLEAMASGLPVFTSDRAGAAELIENGKDGFVLPLNEWLDGTIEGLRDRVRLREVGNRAEETARSRNWQSVVSDVEKVYEQVLTQQ